MSQILPQSVEDYFDTANGDDAAPVAACFTLDAVVQDEGKTIAGRDAIAFWHTQARQKYQFHATVSSVSGTDERPVVTARLTGAFPGAPADLTYSFHLVGGRIAALEIG